MFESVKRGMANTRTRFTERMNIIFDRGPVVDDQFWEGLEEALILSDVGAQAAFDIVEGMRDTATRKALPDAYAVMDALTEQIASTFATSDVNVFDEVPVLVLFVGINGAGKTTTVGKIASAAKRAGRTVVLGCADTFRAAAIEQLEEWARRADVDVVERERGADPASVCYDTIERAEEVGANFVLIDTAGRLHTSDDLMRELEKVVGVVRKRSSIPVRTVLVIDATTGQNGLSQAKLFNEALDLDALIVTKLDGTAKGGIALAVSHELGLPIAMIGVGEGIDDLMVFEAEEFAAALIGAEADEPDASDGIAEAGGVPEAPSVADDDADGVSSGAEEPAPTAGESQEEAGAALEEGVDETEVPEEVTGEGADQADESFSWKDDFGNPDEMVDALGAQRELEVVVEDVDAAGSAAGAEPEQEAPEDASSDDQKTDGVFKRAWKWLRE